MNVECTICGNRRASHCTTPDGKHSELKMLRITTHHFDNKDKTLTVQGTVNDQPFHVKLSNFNDLLNYNVTNLLPGGYAFEKGDPTNDDLINTLDTHNIEFQNYMNDLVDGNEDQ